MEEREVLSFIIGSCVIIFVLLNWAKIRQLPHAKMLLGCFAALFISWLLSVIEDLFWKEKLNFVQHFCSGLSGVLLAVWLRSIFLSVKGDTHRG